MLGRGNCGEHGRIHQDGKADDRIGSDGSNPNSIPQLQVSLQERETEGA